MKTGKPTRLSEKLNADLDMIRADYAASMASQLESFKADLTSIANDARRITETDTRRFLTETRSFYEDRIEQIRNWLTISPWVIVALSLTIPALMMAGSWYWANQMERSALTEMGLTRIEQGQQIWVTLDPDRTELQTCTLAGAPIICIRIVED